MDQPIVDTIVSNLVAQGPIVTLLGVVVWQTRKDLAEAKAEAKEMRDKLLTLTEKIIDVVQQNSTVITQLGEKIDDIT